jgi:hypothetical protein
MKTRNEVITSMCYTYRHDYGLLDDDKQKSLWNTMSQIFDNDISPNMEFKRDPGRTHSCDIAGCAVCDSTFGL